MVRVDIDVWILCRVRGITENPRIMCRVMACRQYQNRNRYEKIVNSSIPNMQEETIERRKRSDLL